MKILLGLAFSGLTFLCFAFGTATFNIAAWSDEARFMCGAIMLILPLFFAIIEYLNPKQNTE